MRELPIRPTTVLVAIPTYNERGNIRPLLELFRQVEGDFHILYVDDNSPDGTGDLVESLFEEWPNLLLMRRAGKLGIGSAHRDAIHYAYSRGYRRLATMDADLTHTPESLVRMLQHIDQTDLVVGSRYLLPNSLPGWNLFRRFLTRLGHFVTCLFLKMPYDATGGLRVYNLETIPEALFPLVRSNGYSFLYESMFILWHNGCRVVEVPIELPARTYGSSKMSLEQILVSVFRLLLLYTNVRVAPELYRLHPAESMPAALESAGAAESAWDRYWGGGPREGAMDLLFEVCATLFRTAFNKPFLERILARFFRPGEKVLHAGCGSGQVDQQVRLWLDLWACDLSKDAVRMYAQVNWPRAQVVQADLFQLPFEDASFDGVYNLGVMEHFSEEEIARAFREFHRVLRPGGRIVIFWPPQDSPIRYVLQAFHWVSGKVESKSQAPLYPPEISRVASREQGQRWLREAGFEPIYCEFSARDLYTQFVFVARKEVSGRDPG